MNFLHNKIVGWLFRVLWPFGSISVYIGSSPREGEENRKDKGEKKCPNNPHPHLLQAQNALALLLSKLVGRPGTEICTAPSHHPTTPTMKMDVSMKFEKMMKYSWQLTE